MERAFSTRSGAVVARRTATRDAGVIETGGQPGDSGVTISAFEHRRKVVRGLAGSNRAVMAA